MAKNNFDELYTGITEDPDSRISTHNKGAGAMFTKRRGDFKIVLKEEYKTLAEARKRELQIKKWGRQKKEFLIARYEKGQKTKQD